MKANSINNSLVFVVALLIIASSFFYWQSKSKPEPIIDGLNQISAKQSLDGKWYHKGTMKGVECAISISQNEIYCDWNTASHDKNHKDSKPATIRREFSFRNIEIQRVKTNNKDCIILSYRNGKKSLISCNNTH